jgi:hypothetical protein
LGTDRIENKIQKGANIPEVHLRAFRMSREEIMYNWLRFIHQIIKNFFLMQGKPLQEDKLFQYRFPAPLWDVIRIFIKNFKTYQFGLTKISLKLHLAVSRITNFGRLFSKRANHNWAKQY